MERIQKLFQLHLLMLMRSQPAISQITLPWLACITDTATPEFHRRISYIIDCNGKTLQYAVMQYMFENGTDIPVITSLMVIPRKIFVAVDRLKRVL